MNPFEFVLLLVLIVTVGRLIERRTSRRRNPASAPSDDIRAADGGRLEELEKRVQVLERIVTDQGYELRQKFRDLEG